MLRLEREFSVSVVGGIKRCEVIFLLHLQLFIVFH